MFVRLGIGAGNEFRYANLATAADVTLVSQEDGSAFLTARFPGLDHAVQGTLVGDELAKARYFLTTGQRA